MTPLPDVLFELLTVDCAVFGAVKLGASETVLAEVLGDISESVAGATIIETVDSDLESADAEKISVRDVGVEKTDAKPKSFPCQQTTVHKN